MHASMKAEAFLLPIAQTLSYIPGGPGSFWNFIGLLLVVLGVLIVLWLSWVGLLWIIKKLAAVFRRK